MEKQLVEKIMEIFSYEREEAEFFTHEHIQRVQATQFCSKEKAIQIGLEMLS